MERLSLEQIHGILLDIMLDIDKFCKESGIVYSLAYGTLLGAVRYGDFIPWDDDADLIMPRADFERFVATYPKDGRYHCIRNTVSDKEFYISGFAKVHDPHTDKFVESRKSRSHYGVSVDIFPLDPLPEDPQSRHAHIASAIHYGRRLRCLGKRFLHGSPLMMLESRLLGRHYLLKKCEQLTRSINPQDTNLVGVLMGATGYQNVHPKDFLDEPGSILFAGHEFLCPKDTDAYLSQIYGKDYIIPPPENQRQGHGDPVYRI